MPKILKIRYKLRLKFFFSKIQKKKTFPRVEAILNPKFGVVISKTATCSLRTDTQTDRQTCMPPYVHSLHILIMI